MMSDKLTIIQGVQQIELEIMDIVHKICVENHIRYSLIYGSLIGAVRHNGFIPWDDDIDICMPRDDYVKFLKVWSAYKLKDYILQNKKTNCDFTQNFTKVRKYNTTFLQEDDTGEYHKGIFIDIFAADRVPEKWIQKMAQKISVAIDLLYTKEHGSGIPNPIISITENFLLHIPRKCQIVLQKWAYKNIMKFNNKNVLKYMIACTLEEVKNLYSADVFENLVLCEFSGREYYRFRDYDSCLSMLYGDYMQLPPENERTWKHSPIIVDFYKNISELDNRIIEKPKGFFDAV